ncbi:MAG: Hpt domain-containing protein [Opitutaceae bacterium]|nr:Hpt domain-containing protein [Opitutaceae bacterium]
MPPNRSLAELASVLGEDNVRTLVRTFLRDWPVALRELGGGTRPVRHRLVHSLKSNARLMGAVGLSQRLAELEDRMADGGGDLAPVDLAGLDADFEAAARELQAFAASGA